MVSSAEGEVGVGKRMYIHTYIHAVVFSNRESVNRIHTVAIYVYSVKLTP